MCPRLAEGLFQEVEGGDRKGAHIVAPVRLAGLHGDSPLDPADDRDAGMPGRVTVAAAGRARRAGLADRPGRVEPLLDLAREQERIGLGRRRDPRHRGEFGLGDPQQFGPRGARIDDGAAHEIGRGAAHRQQRRRYEAGGRGFRDRDRLAARLQNGADAFRLRQQFLYHPGPSLWCCVTLGSRAPDGKSGTTEPHNRSPPWYETILYEEDGPVGTLTLNRPDDGNMFTAVMCHEVRDCIDAIRRETRTRVLVLTGAGDRFLCIGGRKEGMEDTRLYAGVLPTLDMYEAIERLQKPVIASVNGYAVGGGNVLQIMCDITIAKESAIFRQVGPMMGSFDAGFGTWYLEDLVGKKKAKEIWFRNPRLSAREALELGMINQIVPDAELAAATRAMALEIAERGAFALAAIKTAFSARHGGVGGLARLAHDLLLRGYLDSDESHDLGKAFAERRKPDPDKFGH